MKEFIESIHFYSGKNIRESLNNAPYDWRATGTYGVERVLKTEQISQILLIYVDANDMTHWQKYLSSRFVKPTKVLPDLKLVSVDTLPEPSKNDRNVVDISYLIADLERVAPRYCETHSEIIKQLREVA